MFSLFITLLGYGAFFTGLIRFILWIQKQFIRKSNLQSYQTRDRDGWAVITGCTSGIGLAFVHVIARAKINIVLISRDEQKLKALQQNIQEEQYGVKTRYVVTNASEIDDQNVRNIVSAVSSLPIILLINNVGIMHSHGPQLAPLHEMDPRSIQNTIIVNCLFMTRLTAAMIPLLRRTGSARTAILNVSSLASWACSGYASVYSGTKGYIRSISAALSAELKPLNIDVTCIIPAFVQSNMTPVADPLPWDVCSAQACAEGAIKQLGVFLVRPYYIHAIQEYLFSWLPQSMLYQACYDHHKTIAPQRNAQMSHEAE